MDRRTIVLVFCCAFALCALVTKPRALSWNDTSRLATVDSLVSRHTFAIDDSPFAAQTKDKYRFGGHTYSDKPPALALQGAAVAAVLAPFGITPVREPGRAIYLITLFTVGAWFALGCAYAYAFARLLGCEPRRAVLVAALTGLGTLALPYATVLVNHVPAGAAALAGVYHLVRAGERFAHAVAGALFLTLAFAFDASAIVFALAAVVLLWGAPVRIWAAFVAASIPLVLAQLAFNAAVSTGVGPPAMNQTTWADPSSAFHRADQSVFLFASAGDYLRYMTYLLVGDKGLISYTPLTLLCAYGFVRMWAGSRDTRRIAAAIVATVIVYFVLMVAFTNDYGSLNYGERRYADVFFVLCVGLGPALAGLRGAMANIAARVAIAWSIVVAMLGVIAPFGVHRGASGYVFATEEFARLAQRAPVQAVLDVGVLLVTIYLVLRSLSSGAAATPDTGRHVA
ncbi:MAG TPA: hypothetical protein VGX96_19285 [Candidatus Elarobacter sp.]|jgi:hypothetical protein|nr:hypothetical protein [Candidatus Elarobacter sp.]